MNVEFNKQLAEQRREHWKPENRLQSLVQVRRIAGIRKLSGLPRFGPPLEHLNADPGTRFNLGLFTNPDELQAFCKARLAAYKYPRIVEIVSELPKGPTGKILKRELRDDS